MVGLALVVGLSGVDAHWDNGRVIAGTVVIAPFVTALFGAPRDTAIVGLVAIAACTLSGEWNDNWGGDAYVVRLLVVIAGTGFAFLGARTRVRLGIDRDRFRLLARAAQISDVGGGSVAETVQRLGSLLVPQLADVCVIDVLRDDRVERLAVVADGPDAAQIEAGLRARAPGSACVPRDDRVAALRAGQTQLIERATDEDVRIAAHDEADLALLRSLRARSWIVVPLRARGRPIGALTLVVTERSGRRYDADSLEFAQVLSGRVALALDNAGLFTELESLEARQAAVLGSLAEAVTVQAVDGGLVYANDAAARLLGFVSAAALLSARSEEIFEAFDSYTEDGRPVAASDLPGQRVLAGEAPPPLLLRVVHRETREERWQLVKATAVLDGAGRPRLAVNVIEDVTDAKRAELAQRFLAQAGEALASSLDYEETLARVARLVVPQLADWCSVTLPDERGLLRAVAVAHVDPDKLAFALDHNRRHPSRVTDPAGPAEVLRTGNSQITNAVTDELLEATIPDPEQRALVGRLGMRAAMIVPMVGAGGAIGTITFVSAESGRVFTPADLALAEELGRRAGTAVENARLYSERTHISRVLQASLLPDALPEVPGFALASMYRPAGHETFVGGDFYDVFETASGWMLLIGDVTGRGAEAAALTAQARHTLRIAGTLLGDPVAAVRQLNRALTEKAELSICTVAAVLLRPSGGVTTATLLCAGHPPPMLVRGGEARPVGRPGPVVGAWEEATWDTDSIELLARDQLVLYTDGVTDADGEEERFGPDRLATCLRGAVDPDDAVGKIRTALGAFEAGAQADDTAVLAAQWLGAAARGSSEELGADYVPGAR